MGIFSSISQTITAVCSPVIRAANAVDESLDMATTFVHNRSVVFKEEDTMQVATDSAKRQAVLKKELEDNEDARNIYNQLIAKIEA